MFNEGICHQRKIVLNKIMGGGPIIDKNTNCKKERKKERKRKKEKRKKNEILAKNANDTQTATH